MTQPLVSICCLTFNHGPYIRECIEGFIMQKTNFTYEVLIHDDASTDNTATIIREYEIKYFDIIKPIYQTENQYSKKVGILKTFLFPRVTGKYLAICEGDDYWTDPFKLQKQVDILENNTNYGMVYTKTKIFDQDREQFCEHEFGEYRKDIIDLIKLGNMIPTLSVVLRTSITTDYVNLLNKYSTSKEWLLGDYPLWLFAASSSNIFFLNEITGIYRKLKISASHHNGDIEKLLKIESSTVDICVFFSKFYKLGLEHIVTYRFIANLAYKYSKNIINRDLMEYYFLKHRSYDFVTITIKIMASNKFGLLIFKLLYSLHLKKI